MGPHAHRQLYLFPLSQQLLYINSIQIRYNIFLSFFGNKKVEGEGEGEKNKL